jgi:hypothetical protein
VQRISQAVLDQQLQARKSNTLQQQLLQGLSAQQEQVSAAAERIQRPAADGPVSLADLQGDDNIRRLAALRLAALAQKMQSSSSSSSSSSSRQMSGWQQHQQQSSIPAYHLQLLAATGLQDVEDVLLSQGCGISALTNCLHTRRQLTMILNCLEEFPGMQTHSSSRTTTSSSGSSNSNSSNEATLQLLAPILLTCIQVAALAQDAIPDGEQQLLLAIVPFISSCIEGLCSQALGCAFTLKVLRQLRQPVLLLLGPAVLRACAAAAAARTAAAVGELEFISLEQQHDQEIARLKLCVQQLQLERISLEQKQRQLIDNPTQQQQQKQQRQRQQIASLAQRQQQQQQQQIISLEQQQQQQQKQQQQQQQQRQQQQLEPMSADTCAALVSVYSRLLSVMIIIGEFTEDTSSAA